MINHPSKTENYVFITSSTECWEIAYWHCLGRVIVLIGKEITIFVKSKSYDVIKGVFMKKYFVSFVLMLTFLTRIPFPVQYEFSEENYARGIFYFPLIGLIIGVLLWPLTLLQTYVPVSIFPFLLIIGYLLIVGGIHVDGIGDLFDGIFSARDQKRVLEIMSDSLIGAFGVVGIILYFMGIYLGLFEVAKLEWFPLILVSMPIVGRSVSLIGVGFSRYAKDEGLGKAVVDRAGPFSSIVVTVLLLGISFFVSPLMSLSVLITLSISLFILWRIHRALNGITGDVTGAIVEISQIIFILTVSVVIG